MQTGGRTYVLVRKIRKDKQFHINTTQHKSQTQGRTYIQTDSQTDNGRSFPFLFTVHGKTRGMRRIMPRLTIIPRNRSGIASDLACRRLKAHFEGKAKRGWKWRSVDHPRSILLRHGFVRETHTHSYTHSQAFRSSIKVLVPPCKSLSLPWKPFGVFQCEV